SAFCAIDRTASGSRITKVDFQIQEVSSRYSGTSSFQMEAAGEPLSFQFWIGLRLEVVVQ
ncbi:MAG: hypothetical protein ACOYOK_16140, partial [Pseudobdellovibrionaceae bacterium]